MLRNDPEYRRLKVGGHGALGSASYWLGKRHLLVVVVAGYIEKYQRFQYRDVQALFMRKTRVHYIWGFGFAAVAIGCSLGAFQTLKGQAFANLDTESRVGCLVLLGLALVFIGGIIINALRGPTCVCYLRTALQTAPLPQVSRWKQAERLIAALSPIVLAAQASTQATPAEKPLEPQSPAEGGAGNPAPGGLA
ncbi:MAG TPA: hypothetical protein VL361_10695 [Candidatus Limnocylindrales bacterium]|jgi:hypothetical protein|nr:hypothetical protein [Candidatus Limnocylindrales bacterium]